MLRLSIDCKKHRTRWSKITLHPQLMKSTDNRSTLKVGSEAEMAERHLDRGIATSGGEATIEGESSAKIGRHKGNQGCWIESMYVIQGDK